jgi:hypothetical protein
VTTYHVEVDLLTPAPVTPETCMRVDELLPADAGGATGQSLHWNNAVSVAIAIDATNATAAETRGLGLIRHALTSAGVTSLEALDIRVVRWDLFEAETKRRNHPDIVGALEAATILHVSRQRVHQLMHENPEFPGPLYHLRGTGPLWVRSGIEAFDRRWKRKPGRPAKTAAAAG